MCVLWEAVESGSGGRVNLVEVVSARCAEPKPTMKMVAAWSLVAIPTTARSRSAVSGQHVVEAGVGRQGQRAPARLGLRCERARPTSRTPIAKLMAPAAAVNPSTNGRHEQQRRGDHLEGAVDLKRNCSESSHCPIQGTNVCALCL